jgi:hypothetical protein
MRAIRWKSKYQTGISPIDDRTMALVDTLNEVAGEANQVEHCEDLNEFFDEITNATEDMLEKLNASSSDISGEVELLEDEFRSMLVSKLPLAAKGTPACTDCCKCSLLEKRMREWLDEPFTDQAQCKSESS